MNTLLDGGFPRGALNYWKSAFFRGSTTAPIETMVAAFEAVPVADAAICSSTSTAPSRASSPTATAFPHRAPGYNLLIAVEWTDPAETDANVAGCGRLRRARAVPAPRR